MNKEQMLIEQMLIEQMDVVADIMKIVIVITVIWLLIKVANDIKEMKE